MASDERLKPLPVPTPEQTARFAEHVADNHSWYKHLPFFPPGASFVVFPNPHAGRGTRADGDRFAVYDVERGDYFEHHSRLPTAEYRARFGHWDYWVEGNPREFDPKPGPWLYSDDGSRREVLADGLKRQWSCRLTAFVKPGPTMFNLNTSLLPREAEAFWASSPSRLGRVLRGLFGTGDGASSRDAERYRRLCGELRRADGSWRAPSMQFMESEATIQRGLLLDTLHRVRAAWSEGRAADAEPGRMFTRGDF